MNNKTKQCNVWEYCYYSHLCYFWYIPNDHRILDFSLTYNLLVDENKFLYNRKKIIAIQKSLQLFKQLFKFRYLNRCLYLWGQGIRKNSLTKPLYRKLMFNTFLSKCLWGELVMNTQILQTSGYHIYKISFSCKIFRP